MIDQYFDVVKEQWVDILWFDETFEDKKTRYVKSVVTVKPGEVA
ncbi:MAG: hypothetical protein U9N36_09945 [Euryarchaeota archaeon]|nr:hypothetical protein [Euryarchaeota archaeon]